MAKDCKPGKEKNANGRCVKIKNVCGEGKEKNANGRCVKKCTATQRRSRSGKCVSKRRPISSTPVPRPQLPFNSAMLNSQRHKLSAMYKKPLPIPAGKFRGQLLTRKRNLKKKKTTTDSAYGYFNF